MSSPAPQPQRPSSPLRVLVLGAGWLGLPLAEAFAAEGAVVTTVRRGAHEPVAGGRALAVNLAELPTASPGDARAREGLRTLFGASDLVIAAVAPDRSAGDTHASTYPAAAAAAVAIADATEARALVWVSSTGVYGYTDGREVTEQTRRAGSGAAFEALARAEDTVLAAPTSTHVVLRVAGLYGPARDPAPRYRDPSALDGRWEQWLNLAWRDDVIGAIRSWTAAALRGDAVPSVLNVADGTPLTIAEAARLVARADGRVLQAPPAGDEPPPSSGRSNQRVRVELLRSLGWRPSVPHLRVGLQRLGYERLGLEHQPYGPESGAVRALLRDLAALDVEAHRTVCDRWEALRDTPELARADRLLGETMVRVHREAERDAAAGPLLQMLRPTKAPPEPAASTDDEATRTEPAAMIPDDEAPLDPIAEPALAALMAVVVRDALPEATFRLLTSSVAAAIPWLSESTTAAARDAGVSSPYRDAFRR